MNATTSDCPWDFSNPTIPTKLFYLLRAGKLLTVTDLLLLIAINQLTRRCSDGSGLGCWASNRKLAEIANVHAAHVSKRIQFLWRRCFIVIIELNGQRYLECEWSRTAIERNELQGDYGIAFRREYQALERRARKLAKRGLFFAGLPGDPTISTPKQKGLGGVSKNAYTPPKQKGLPILTPLIEDTPSPATRDAGENVKASPISGFNSTNNQPPDSWRELAGQLYKGLHARGKIVSPKRTNLVNWAKTLRDTLGERFTPEQLTKIVRLHVDNIRGQWWPKAYSAESFCEKFPQIEDAIDRMNQERGEEPRKTRQLVEECVGYTKKGERIMKARYIDV